MRRKNYQKKQVRKWKVQATLMPNNRSGKDLDKIVTPKRRYFKYKGVGVDTHE